MVVLQLNAAMVLIEQYQHIHPIDVTTNLMNRASKETIAHCTNKFVECFGVDEDGVWKLDDFSHATYRRRQGNGQDYNPRSDGPLCSRVCAKSWGVSYGYKKAVIDEKIFLERFLFLERLKLAIDDDPDMDEGQWNLDFKIVKEFKKGNVLASLMESVRRRSFA